MMRIRATWERVIWVDSESDDYTLAGGFCDPDDPWDHSQWVEVPDACCGAAFLAWRDENVITLKVSPKVVIDYKAAFPGGIWQERESESTMQMNGACESVTLHIEEV